MGQRKKMKSGNSILKSDVSPPTYTIQGYRDEGVVSQELRGGVASEYHGMVGARLSIKRGFRSRQYKTREGCSYDEGKRSGLGWDVGSSSKNSYLCTARVKSRYLYAYPSPFCCT